VTLLRLERLRAPGAMPARACGDCTACCTLMAVTELRKPSRRACDHVRTGGCAIHPERPAGCRLFHCLWLRGAVGVDEAQRPDALGVMFDYFVTPASGEEHTLAFEVWPGALDAPAARAIVDALARSREVRLSYRDGRWSAVAAE
jgi:uncharacterized protein